MRPMTQQRRLALAVAWAMAIAGVLMPVHGSTAARGSEPRTRDLFDEIYARALPFERSLKTIRGSFTETTESPLLTAPLVSEGDLVVARPSDVLLTYRTPERKVLKLDAHMLLFVWPDRGLRQQRDIADAQSRVQRYFVGRSPDELRSHFTIATREEPGEPRAWRIDMQPRRKQIRDGLTRLELWIRQDTMLPRAMRFEFPGGSAKTMSFRDLSVNAPVAAADLEVPD
jgi:hypothetical protein